MILHGRAGYELKMEKDRLWIKRRLRGTEGMGQHRLEAGKQVMKATALVRMLLSLVMVLTAAVLPVSGVQRSDLPLVPHVLIINSYHPGYAWTEGLEDAMVARLEQEYPGVDISSEYLDWKHNPDPDKLALLLPVIAQRYGTRPPDIILTTDDAALDFVMANRHDYFKDIPVVFCGVPREKGVAVAAANDRVTGVIQNHDVEGTIRLALKTRPDTKRFHLVFENSETGLPLGEAAERACRALAPEAQVERWNDLPATEIRRRSALLEPGDVVLFLVYNRDIDGNVLPMQQYADLLFASCPVPVFGLYDYLVGHHVLGGSVIDASLHGTEAVEMAIPLLKNPSAKPEPVRDDLQVTTRFDYLEMERIGLPVSAIPAGAEIMNRPANVFRDNQALFLSIFAVILFLVVLTVGLLLNIRIRRRTERQLQASHEELMAVNEQMTAVNAALTESEEGLRSQNHELAEQKRRLELSEERYRLVGEATRDAIWDWDISSDKLIISDRIREMTGWNPADGDRMQDWFPRILPVDRARVEDMLRQNLLRQLGSWSAEYRILSVSGEERWILSRGMTVHDEAGHPIRMVGTHADITDMMRQRDTIAHMAYYDALTGLPNRTMMKSRVETLTKVNRENGRHLVILYSDLDNFKVVNDSFGHPTGDRLLRVMAERFQHAVPSGALVGRMGGDEFAIILEDDENSRLAEDTARAILRAFSQPLQIDGMQFHVGMSIGIASHPRDGEDFDALLRSADTAMYAAKGAGKSQYRVFDQVMDAAARDRFMLEDGLRHALARNELLLHYQPVHNLETGRLEGFEALLRWQSGEFGNIPPNRFIPIAEETGLIVPIGTWVLQEASRFARQLLSVFGDATFHVGVNVSVLQLMQAGFQSDVCRTLEDTGLPPTRLLLEITESVLMESFGQNAQTLGELSAMGIWIALDDFGTGYSSLTYLRKLPIQVLKIDKSFIDDIHDANDEASHTGSIVRLAREWGFSVVAEGVEHEYQKQYLARAGCDMMQGYLASRPLPVEAALAYAVRLAKP